jgi:hypothetical protein
MPGNASANSESTRKAAGVSVPILNTFTRWMDEFAQRYAILKELHRVTNMRWQKDFVW